MNAIAEAETQAALPVLAEDYRPLESNNIAVSVGAVSVSVSFGMVEKMADLSVPPRRPARRPRRTVAEDTALLARDADLMRSFHNGVTELNEGKGISWADLKKELGL